MQVARMPRIRHFMIRRFFEEAYGRHLRDIYLVEETHERHNSLRRHLRGDVSEVSERYT
jgi:hypothetical protein